MFQGIKEGRSGAINMALLKKNGETFIFAFYDSQLPELLADLKRRSESPGSGITPADAAVVASAARRSVRKSSDSQRGAK